MADNRARIFYGYVIVIAAMCIMAISFGTFLSFGVFFKPVLNEFGWTRAVLSGALTVSLVVQGLFGILAGRLADKYNPRLLITIGGAITGAGFAFAAEINSVLSAYLTLGGIVGFGISSIVVPLNVTLSKWFIRRRAMATGIVLAGTGIGSFLIPPLAEWLISDHGWRFTYIIVGVAIAAICIASAQLLRRSPAEMGQQPDGALPDATVRASINYPSFTLQQASRTSYFWIVGIIFFCLGFCRFIILTHLVPYITDIGFSAVIAAWILSVNGIFNMFGRILMGFLADKIGDRRNFIIGFSVMSAGLILLLSGNQGWVFFVFAAVFGFSHAGIGTSEAPLLTAMFGVKALGIIYGVLSLSLLIGGAVGPLVGGYIYDTADSYQIAFSITLVLALAALILSCMLPRTADKRVN